MVEGYCPLQLESKGHPMPVIGAHYARFKLLPPGCLNSTCFKTFLIYHNLKRMTKKVYQNFLNEQKWKVLQFIWTVLAVTTPETWANRGTTRAKKIKDGALQKIIKLDDFCAGVKPGQRRYLPGQLPILPRPGTIPVPLRNFLPIVAIFVLICPPVLKGSLRLWLL